MSARERLRVLCEEFGLSYTENLRAECVRLFRAGWFRRGIAAKLGLTISQVRRRIEDVLGPGNKSDGAYRRSARGFRPSGRKGVKARLVKP